MINDDSKIRKVVFFTNIQTDALRKYGERTGMKISEVVRSVVNDFLEKKGLIKVVDNE